MNSFLELEAELQMYLQNGPRYLIFKNGLYILLIAIMTLWCARLPDRVKRSLPIYYRSHY